MSCRSLQHIGNGSMRHGAIRKFGDMQYQTNPVSGINGSVSNANCHGIRYLIDGKTMAKIHGSQVWNLNGHIGLSEWKGAPKLPLSSFLHQNCNCEKWLRYTNPKTDGTKLRPVQYEVNESLNHVYICLYIYIIIHIIYIYINYIYNIYI